MILVKLTSLTLAALLFFALFVFGPFYSNVPLQGAVLAGVLIWHLFRYSFKETISLLKFCIPFIITLLIFGLIFHWVQLQGRQDWLADTLIKCLVFPSSVTILKVLLSYITYLDLLGLPLSMDRRLDLITLKAAFQKGSFVMKRFAWYLNTYGEHLPRNRFKFSARRYACLIIALFLYLYEEIEDAHHLLQNRYHHLGEVEE